MSIFSGVLKDGEKDLLTAIDYGKQRLVEAGQTIGEHLLQVAKADIDGLTIDFHVTVTITKKPGTPGVTSVVAEAGGVQTVNLPSGS